MPYRKPEVTPDWMKLAEAAGRLDCHPQTVLNRINSGTIPVRVLRFGRVVRVHRREFETFMDKRSTPAAASA